LADGLAERLDRGLVAGNGTDREVGRDPEHGRVASGQRGGGVPVQRQAQGRGHLVVDRLAKEIVAERQLLAVLHEHAGGERFADRQQEFAGRLTRHLRQLDDRERRAENGGDLDHRARRLRQRTQVVNDYRRERSRHLVIAFGRRMLDVGLAQNLDQIQRVPLSPGNEPLQLRVWAAPEQVRGEPCGRLVVERRERQAQSPLLSEPLEQCLHLPRCWEGATAEQPHDRIREQLQRERAQGRHRGGVGPVQVIDHDHERPLTGSPFERHADALEDFEAPVNQPAQRHQLLTADDHRIGRGQRIEQRRPRGHLIELIAAARRDHQALLGGELGRLGQQPALADPGRAFDHGQCALSPLRRDDQPLQIGQLGLAPAQRPRADERPRHDTLRHRTPSSVAASRHE